MKLTTEVVKQESCGDEAKVTLGNVRRKKAAFWREYNESININMPFSSLKSFPVGRVVEVEIRPKGKL